MLSLNRTIVGLKCYRHCDIPHHNIGLNRTIVGLKLNTSRLQQKYIHLFESNYSRIEIRGIITKEEFSELRLNRTIVGLKYVLHVRKM